MSTSIPENDDVRVKAAVEALSKLQLVDRGWVNRVENDLKAEIHMGSTYADALGRILQVKVDEDEGAWHLLHRIHAIAQEALTGKR